LGAIAGMFVVFDKVRYVMSIIRDERGENGLIELHCVYFNLFL
jgi:hypothetical protein